MAQLQFCDATRILFFCAKKAKITIYVFRHFFGGGGGARAWTKSNLRLGESVRIYCDTLQNGGRCNSGEKNGWVNCYFCFLCAKKNSRSVANGLIIVISIYANCNDHNERMQKVSTTTFSQVLKVKCDLDFWWDLPIEIEQERGEKKQEKEESTRVVAPTAGCQF